MLTSNTFYHEKNAYGYKQITTDNRMGIKALVPPNNEVKAKLVPHLVIKCGNYLILKNKLQ